MIYLQPPFVLNFSSFDRLAGRPGRRATLGFTLVELLVTLAVAAMLLSFGVPSLRTFVQDSRVAGAADSFLSAIQHARSEAITRGDTVTLCRTADPSTDNCGTSADEDWTPGWLMYSVPNFTGEEDYTASADNVLIQRGAPAHEEITITSDTHGNQWLTIGPDGTLREDGAVAYAVCDVRGVEKGKLIVIPMIGRPYVTDNMGGAPGCEPS